MEMDKRSMEETDLNTHGIISEASQTSLTKMKVSLFLFTNLTRSPKVPGQVAWHLLGCKLQTWGSSLHFPLNLTTNHQWISQTQCLASPVDFNTHISLATHICCHNPSWSYHQLLSGSLHQVLIRFPILTFAPCQFVLWTANSIF